MIFRKWGGGSKAIWNFSEKTSVLVGPSVPKGLKGYICTFPKSRGVVGSSWGFVVPSWPVGKGLPISLRPSCKYFIIFGIFLGQGAFPIIGFCRFPGARLKITFGCYQVKVGDCRYLPLGQLAWGFLPTWASPWKDSWVRSTFLSLVRWHRPFPHYMEIFLVRMTVSIHFAVRIQSKSTILSVSRNMKIS